MLKPVNEEDGVSEVIGTILILAITVVLFSAVFAYVDQIPKASSPVQVYFSSNLSYDHSTGVLYENVTDEGGSIILRNSTYFVVFTSNKVYRFSVGALNVTAQHSHHPSYLEPGDTLHWSSVLLPGGEVYGEFKTMIQYVVTGQVLWEASYNLSSLPTNPLVPSGGIEDSAAGDITGFVTRSGWGIANSLDTSYDSCSQQSRVTILFNHYYDLGSYHLRRCFAEVLNSGNPNAFDSEWQEVR
ncbi:MAG: type IV pilin N-terminal domain-containing protein [Thermoplasmata archaeon]